MKPRTRHLLTAAVILALSSGVIAADGVLTDDLNDLTNSVNNLSKKPPVATPVTPAQPNIPVAQPKPPVAQPAQPVNPGGGTLGDDLGDLEKTVGSLSKPGTGKPPVITTEKPPTIGGEKPPVIIEKPPIVTTEKPPIALGQANINEKEWDFKAVKGVTIKDGEMALVAAGAADSSVAANYRTPLAGDFELRVAFTLPTEAVGKRAELSRGLGIRIESDAKWKGDRLLSIDRTADKEGDIILAAHSEQLEGTLTARPKGSACEIRVRRKGDKFRIALREENAATWTDLGEVEAAMSPKLQLRLTTYVTGGEARASIRNVEVAPGR